MTREAIANTVLAIILLAAPAVAWMAGETFYVTLATRMAVLALAAVGLNLALGLGGLVSFGHGAWFGLSAYIAALVQLRMAPGSFAVLSLTLAPIALLFAPVLLGARTLYPWAWSPGALDPVARLAVERRHALFTVAAFGLRSLVFLSLWALLAGLLHRGSTRARTLSAAALPPFALTLTFAAFDWFMSLDPTWCPNLYGVYLFAGGFSAAVAAVTLLAWALRRAGRLPAAIADDHFHASARVLLLAVSLWAYLAFVQVLLVWIADLPSEVGWLRARSVGGWAVVSVVLAIGHFALPFFALLQRAVTRHPSRLALVAAWLVLAHAVDLHWLIAPSLRPGRASPTLTDLGALLLMLGLLGPFVAWRLGAVSASPSPDPSLAGALEYRSR